MLIHHFSFAQNLTNSGTDFWATYPLHQSMEPGNPNSQELTFLITALQPATVTVSIHGTPWTRTYNIAANATVQTDLIPKSGSFDARLYSVPPNFGGTGGEGRFVNKGIHIVSDVPITVISKYYNGQQNATAMIYPVQSWGIDYTSLNYKQDLSNNAFTFLNVIAKEDNTVIEIVSPVLSRNGRPANVPYSITLNKGDIYQVVGRSQTMILGEDLTGTTIKVKPNASNACNPVAVFSGSSGTRINCTSGTYSNNAEHLLQQAFPKHTWGKRYVTASFMGPNVGQQMQTIYRVLVQDPATIVNRNGVPLTGLLQNSYYEFESQSGDVIEANKPVMVGQYMGSTGSCGNPAVGDVDMIFLSPVSQALNQAVFRSPALQSIGTGTITVIIPAAGLNSVRINGSNAFNHTYPHPADPRYSVAVKQNIAPDAFYNITSNYPFTAYAYALGTGDSYGFNTGMQLNNQEGIGSFRNEANTTTDYNDSTCINSGLRLSVLLTYIPASINWQADQAGAAITPNTPFVQVGPTPSGTKVIDGITYNIFTNPVSYRFSMPGAYNIPVEAAPPATPGSCGATAKFNIPVQVVGAPAAGIAVTQASTCTLDTIHLSGSITSSITPSAWTWTFPGGVTETGKDVKKLLPPGVHNIKLSVSVLDGCGVEAFQNVTVTDKPAASFTASTPSVCEGFAITYTDNSPPGQAIAERYWSFGNGTSTSVASNAPQSPVYNTYGNVEVKMVAKASALCISDTARGSYIVYSKPQIILTPPAGCLTANDVAAFTSDPVTPDGQPVNTFEWEFGDGGTSALKDPSHTYTANGNFTVRYKAYTAGGCPADTTFTVAVGIRPQLSYNIAGSICDDPASPPSLAFAAVTNGVAGTGAYAGTGVNAMGGLIPGVLPYGTHPVKYIFTANGGCKDSVSTIFDLRQKPVIALSVPLNCLPASGESLFTNNSQVSDGTVINSHSWNFGDGSTASAAEDPVHIYARGGNYTVQYSAATSGGCSRDTSFSYSPNLVPLLSYGLIPPVCLNAQMPVSVANAIITNNIQGSGTYSGTGVTRSGLFNAGATGEGTFPVQFNFVSNAGCPASATSNVTVNTPPGAAFTTDADTVCQGIAIKYTDMSGGGVTKWNWQFSDGSVSNVANPEKTFSTSGVQNAVLRVENAAGCISDPFNDEVFIAAVPVINAGPDLNVAAGSTVQMQPQSNTSPYFTYRWTPAQDFIDPDILNASFIANEDAVYTLTASAFNGRCVASDDIKVEILRPVSPPNAFSPNGDNINDTWIIRSLNQYPGCTVEVFNRYGRQVFQSAGYATPWNGAVNGSPLPVGTYYYVIRLRPGAKPISGSVTILK